MDPDGQMDEEKQNLDGDRDSAIDRLIRRANKLPRPEIERPSPEVIDAYLLGTATEEQRQKVYSALANSSLLRKDILAEAIELDELSSSEVRENLQRIEIEECPDLMSVIFPDRVSESRTPPVESIWETLGRHVTFRRLVPIAAVITLVLLILVWNHEQEEPKPQLIAEWQLASAGIPKEQLITLRTRDATGASAATSFADADSAALAELRHLVYLSPKDYELHVVEKIKRAQVPVSRTQVLLRLARPDGSLIQEFKAILPDSATAGSRSAVAWALGLPERNLYSYPITSDTAVVTWSDEMGAEGAVTFTYRDNDGYHAVVGFVFKTL